MNILLLGAGGQLGRALAAALPALGTLTALDRSQANLADLDALPGVVRRHRPDLLVNAAAYTAVDRAEREPQAAQRVNAEAVAVLAAEARRAGALLLHYSTDYVFDGAKPAPYVESDAAHPLNAYGRSKLAGERAVLDSGCRALVLRLSWVYSADPQARNFVNAVLAQACTRDTLDMVADQVGAPTSAARIAAVSAQAAQACLAGRLAPGLYHLSAAGSVDRHTLARHIVARALRNGWPLRLRPEGIAAVPTPAASAAGEDRLPPVPASHAPRPLNSRLDGTALSRALGLALPDWREDLDAMLDARRPPQAQPLATGRPKNG